MSEDRQSIIADLERIAEQMTETIETLQANIREQIEQNEKIIQGRN